MCRYQCDTFIYSIVLQQKITIESKSYHLTAFLSYFLFSSFFFLLEADIFSIYFSSYFIPMLEELPQQPLDDRHKSSLINQQIVKLLQQKTLPLNRQRYLHLQKINRTNAKFSIQTETSPNNLALNFHTASSPHSPTLPALNKSKSTRYYHQAAADLLINRLKNLKDLKHNSQLLSKDKLAGRCWEKLRSSIIESQQTGRTNDTAKPSQKILKTNEGRRHKEHYLELTKRAQRYLRVKKHELKEKHIQSVEYSKPHRHKTTNPSELQLFVSNFKLKIPQKSKQMTHDQLQLQILHDIREIMLEENLNRLKMDINHRKIVQLR